VKQSAANKRKHYARKKRSGLCVSCGRKSRKGKVHCATCNNRTLERQKEYKSSKPWVKANNHRMVNYGITPERYADMLYEQFGKCGVCGKFFTKTPHTDHNHKTNKPRGLLCPRCNTSIWILEDPVLKEKAEKYLARYGD
jgi:predicted amidophosphoribosyltransferase